MGNGARTNVLWGSESFLEFVLLSKNGPECALTYRLSAAQFPLNSEKSTSADSALTALHTVREKAVREDIARRVRPVCSHCTDAEFTELVRKMAEQQVRYERKLAW